MPVKVTHYLFDTVPELLAWEHGQTPSSYERVQGLKEQQPQRHKQGRDAREKSDKETRTPTRAGRQLSSSDSMAELKSRYKALNQRGGGRHSDLSQASSQSRSSSSSKVSWNSSEPRQVKARKAPAPLPKKVSAEVLKKEMRTAQLLDSLSEQDHKHAKEKNLLKELQREKEETELQDLLADKLAERAETAKEIRRLMKEKRPQEYQSGNEEQTQRERKHKEKGQRASHHRQQDMEDMRTHSPRRRETAPQTRRRWNQPASPRAVSRGARWTECRPLHHPKNHLAVTCW